MNIPIRVATYIFPFWYLAGYPVPFAVYPARLIPDIGQVKICLSWTFSNLFNI